MLITNSLSFFFQESADSISQTTPDASENEERSALQAETKRLALEQLHKAKVKSNSQLFLIYRQQALNPNFTIDLLSPWKLIFFNKLLCHLSK